MAWSQRRGLLRGIYLLRNLVEVTSLRSASPSFLADETPIWLPAATVASMKAEAALPRRGSEKRYQIAACVSAIAAIINNQNAENSRTSRLDSRRFPQPRERGHTLQESLAMSGLVPCRAIRREPRLKSSQAPHVPKHPERRPLPELQRRVWLPPAVAAAM